MLKYISAFAVSFTLIFAPIMSNASPYGDETSHSNRIVFVDGTLHEYLTPDAAQHHCPKDTIVWLNTRTGIWHLQGERWYGRTRQGAYVCEQEAAKAGDRETLNGQ